MPTKRKNLSSPTDLTDDEERALIDPIRLELAHRYAKAKDILNWGRILFPHKFPLPFCVDLHTYFVSIRHFPITAVEATALPLEDDDFQDAFRIPRLFQALEEPDTFNFIYERPGDGQEGARDQHVDPRRARGGTRSSARFTATRSTSKKDRPGLRPPERRVVFMR